MPDIAMCKGDGCSRREQCYRAMAKPDKYWQTYFTTAPVKEDGECGYFEPIGKGDEVLKKGRTHGRRTSHKD